MKKYIFTAIFLLLFQATAICDGLHRVVGVVTDMTNDGKTITLNFKGSRTDINFLQNTDKFKRQIENSLRRGVAIVVITRETQVRKSMMDATKTETFIEDVSLYR